MGLFKRKDDWGLLISGTYHKFSVYNQTSRENVGLISGTYRKFSVYNLTSRENVGLEKPEGSTKPCQLSPEKYTVSPLCQSLQIRRNGLFL